MTDYSANRKNKPIIVNISNRHCHLHQDDMEKLFGKGHKLTKTKDLMQPGEHACQETVAITGSKGDIPNVRVLGPLRKATQVEISMTDSIHIGAGAPVRTSGDIAGSAAVKITGPAGSVELKEGCIVAKRHVHMTPADAEFFGIKDKDNIRIKIEGERGLIFDNVTARVSPNMTLECHLDIDEANAAGAKNGNQAFIL
ncbi:MAG: phosphate propanoyltransferase [Elusimicrobiota bacterium]